MTRDGKQAAVGVLALLAVVALEVSWRTAPPPAARIQPRAFVMHGPARILHVVKP